MKNCFFSTTTIASILNIIIYSRTETPFCWSYRLFSRVCITFHTHRRNWFNIWLLFDFSLARHGFRLFFLHIYFFEHICICSQKQIQEFQLTITHFLLNLLFFLSVFSQTIILHFHQILWIQNCNKANRVFSWFH